MGVVKFRQPVWFVRQPPVKAVASERGRECGIDPLPRVANGGSRRSYPVAASRGRLRSDEEAQNCCGELVRVLDEERVAGVFVDDKL
jgi:hypothetical protein